MNKHIRLKKIVLLLALASILLASSLLAASQPVQAAGGRCYSGMAFYEKYQGGSWHWYTYVPISSVDYFKPVTAWRAYGPTTVQLWPDSAPGRYILVYFSWPHGLSPYLRYRPSQFGACLN